MATSAVETKAIVVTVPAEVLGPGSPYEIRRLELRKEYGQVLVSAKSIQVTDEESAQLANNAGRTLQAAKKELEEFYTPIKRQLDAIKKPVLEAEKTDIGEIDAELKRLGSALTAWKAEQERKRLAAEAAARAEAEKAAAAAREEEERILREQQLQRAIELESLGDTAAAEAVLEETIELPPALPVAVVAPVQAPVHMPGSVGRMNYSAKLISLKALVDAISQGKAPLNAITWNESFCNAEARLHKEGYSIVGTELVKTPATSFRA